MDPDEPAAVRCVTCRGLIRFKRGAPLNGESGRFYWHYPGSYCEACSPATNANAAETAVARQIEHLKIPEVLSGFRLDQCLYQRGTESWKEFYQRALAAKRAQRKAVLGVTPWNKKAYDFCTTWSLQSPWFWLWGPSGSGKSALMAGLVAKLLGQKVDVLWLNETALYEFCYGGTFEERAERLKRLKEVQVLFLDGLGAKEGITDAQYNLMQDIVVDRANAMRPMVISSLWPMTHRDPEIGTTIGARYGEMVLSRVIGMTERRQFGLWGGDWFTGAERSPAFQKPAVPRVVKGQGEETARVPRPAHAAYTQVPEESEG